MSEFVYDTVRETTFPSLEGNKYYRSDIPRLDPDQKVLWLEALTNEEQYPQGQNMLKTPAGHFCCLGVYCDAAGVPEHEEDGFYNDGSGMPAEGVYPVFGDRSVKGDDGIERDQTTSAIIPEGYGIAYINPPEPNCSGSWKVFNGDEDVFYCQEQGPINDVTGDANVPEEHRRIVGWALPSLNDHVELNFSQIRDVINYFL